MASSSPRLSRAMEYMNASENYGTLGKTVMTVLGGIVVMIGAVIAALGDAWASFLTTILDAFGVGARSWIYAFMVDPPRYIGQSFQAGAESFTGTAWSQLGPFLPWLGALVSIGVVAMVTFYLDRKNSDVPGTGLDIPGIGNDEDGQPDDGDA